MAVLREAVFLQNTAYRFEKNGIPFWERIRLPARQPLQIEAVKDPRWAS
jgi:hypothetical protein